MVVDGKIVKEDRFVALDEEVAEELFKQAGYSSDAKKVASVNLKKKVEV